MSELVRVEREGDLAVVTIDNPPVNALNHQVMQQLDSIFTRLAEDLPLAVIVTGAGEKAFVAGADISEFPTLNKANGKKLGAGGQAVFNRIAAFPSPVIAAVNGFALGGGLELALACDIRVAAENARLGLPEVSLGILPGYGGTQRLPRLIPVGKAKEMIFTGAHLTAEEAYRVGIADRLVPAGASLTAAKEVAALIMSRGPVAVRMAKKAVNEGIELPLGKGLDLESDYFAELCDTEDKNEGAKAFLEKRKPEFKGR